MRYVALLRGVNVGGRAKVEMPRLRATFEALGLGDVVTYLNTGNVVFDGERDRPALVAAIERAVAAEFDLEVGVLLRDGAELAVVVDALAGWGGDGDQRREALFLWPAYDRPDVLDQLSVNPDVEEVRYVPGAVLWRLERAKASRSKVRTLIGTDLYRNLSMRSAGTVEALHRLATGGPARGTTRRHPGAGRGGRR